MKHSFKHFSHYLPLVGMLFFTALAFTQFYYEKTLLIAVSFAVSIAYVVWGAIHHTIHKDITVKILSEYIFVALIGLIMLLSVVFWM